MCSSPNAVRMMTSKGVTWIGCEARVEEKNATVLVGGNVKEREHLGRLGHRWSSVLKSI
jgi:hypothetical protein